MGIVRSEYVPILDFNLYSDSGVFGRVNKRFDLIASDKVLYNGFSEFKGGIV